MSRRPQDQRRLRYFGLPGEDFLDIRHFHSVLKDMIIALEFLGFDREVSSAGNVSFQEIRNLELVDSTRASIREDNLSALSDTASLASQAFRQAGPFDVINIDLCDSFGSGPPGIGSSLYNSVAAILGVQKRAPEPWLFLLTTRIDKDAIDSDVVVKLDKLIHSNVTDCESFRNQFERRIVDDFTGLNSTHGEVFFNCVVCGYAKWFAGLAEQIGCHFKLHGAHKYAVHEQAHADMVSLIFIFEPIHAPVTDGSGLAETAFKPVSECQMVKDVPRVVQEAIDVDGLIEADTAIRTRCVDESKDLLMQARYDVTEYEAEFRTRWA